MKSEMRQFTLAALIFMAVSTCMGVELLVNGDFSLGSSGWTDFIITNTPTVDYAYTTDAPTGGSGNVLRIQATNANVGVYQAITLTAGTKYTLSGVAKGVATWNQGWLEIYLGQTTPTASVDYTDNGLVAWNWWGCGQPTSFDVPFSSACSATTEFVPSVSGTYYLVLKGGSLNGGFGEYLLDNVSLNEDVPVPPQVLPLIADFNTDLNNNLLGGTGGAHCNNIPLINANLGLTADGGGFSGLAGDKALDLDVDSPKCSGDNWIGMNHHQKFSEIDITGAILSFDAKLGSGTAHANWFIRLEDSDLTLPGEFLNVTFDFTLTTSWQTFELPVSYFTPDDGSQQVDLTLFNNIVIEARDPGIAPTDPVEIDIQLDNLSIMQPTAAEGDLWRMYE